MLSLCSALPPRPPQRLLAGNRGWLAVPLGLIKQASFHRARQAAVWSSRQMDFDGSDLGAETRQSGRKGDRCPESTAGSLQPLLPTTDTVPRPRGVGRKKGRRLQACPGPDPDPLPLTWAGHIQSGSGGLAQQYWGRGEEHQALNPTAPPLPPAGLNSSAHTNGL